MHLMFVCGLPDVPAKAWDFWIKHFSSHMPQLTCSVWSEETENFDHVDFAIVWKPPAGVLASMEKLQGIFSLGAGVDHLLSDPDLPKTVPIARVVDPNLTQRMTEYVVMHCLMHHRRARYFIDEQNQERWSKDFRQPAAADRSIGILGIGELGMDSARKLRDIGFQMRGWSQSPKQETGITFYQGQEELDDFLTGVDILVCLLPLTKQTTGILNRDLFAKLSPNTYLINAARGGHLVESDLIPALDAGQLSGAALDVFAVEPLPTGHPFWSDPRILVTPHNAADSDPRSTTRLVASNIQRVQDGQPMLNLVDLERGY